MTVAASSLRLLLRRCAVLWMSIAFGSAFAANAQQRADAPLLHAMFQDHAVLQRDKPIRIWGHAKPTAQVQVTLAGKKVRVKADAHGYWEAQLSAFKAEGPYTLTATAGRST
jgi:sialate O-acetylesterase